MYFKATCSLEDGRLIEGKIYYGTLVGKGKYGDLRIVVYDEKKEWMTFDPKVFLPANQ